MLAKWLFFGPLNEMAKTTALTLKSELSNAVQQRLAGGDIDISSFAKKMNTSRSAVRRILDKNNTGISLQTLARAADVVGLEISFEVRQKSPAELTALARKLASATSPSKSAALRKQLITGFYGKV